MKRKIIYNSYQREERVTRRGRHNAVVAALTVKHWPEIRKLLPPDAAAYLGAAYLKITAGKGEVSEDDFPAIFIKAFERHRRNILYAKNRADDFPLKELEDYAVD